MATHFMALIGFFISIRSPHTTPLKTMSPRVPLPPHTNTWKKKVLDLQPIIQQKAHQVIYLYKNQFIQLTCGSSPAIFPYRVLGTLSYRLNEGF